FDGFLELARLFLPQLLPRPLGLRDVLHSVRFLFGISRAKIERAEIDRVVGCGLHYAKGHSHKTALWRRALAFRVELDGAGAELEPLKPDDLLPGLVELDGRRAILLNKLRRADAALPSLSLGHGL